MYKTLLINRINPQDYTKKKKNIFIMIGDMNISHIENKLIDTIKNSGLVSDNEAIYKYNGVILNISVQTIPDIVKILAKEDISIYSIYEVYEPEV
jgi:hypothetical protein